MGYFRRVKISKYTREEILKEIEIAKDLIQHKIWNPIDPEPLDDLLEKWAVWREALARYDNENKSVLDE